MTNVAILTGRLARDPEARHTNGGTSITAITVVTDRAARNAEGKTYRDENGYTAKESEFHRVTCFNGLSKTVAEHCTKGQLVSVQGRIHYTQWDDGDGVTRYGTEILADKVDFLSRGKCSSED
ncbi:MAG: single-stranded DNA-binding protein [Erythrobacter sp.]|jgi:single-strand DNA-binding protein|nr:single-stranded DNA-binding protein [Erythrobacter sp.]